ncbi:MAG: hypothetical protein M1821_004480 [Bathelium mastoideum]|nr:MAG: hypothetical protein M1821_004480 [Bathelium mastoideum]
MERRLRDPTLHERRDVEALSEGVPEFEEVQQRFLDVSMIRDAMKKYDTANLRALGPPEAGLLEERQMITLRDGHETSAWILRLDDHASTNIPRPIVVLFHGGGFTLGTADHMVPYARGLVRLFNAVVISATYRLAPEYPHPYGPMDAWDAVVWTARNANSLGADPKSGFIVGGVSAGGNLAVVLSQQAKSQKLDPPLTGAWVCVPLLEPPEKHSSLWFSREQNADAPCLSTAEQGHLDEYYAADMLSPWYSPFNHEDALIDLPPAYLQVCGGDPLRDDGLVLHQVFKDSGVKTRMDLYPGMPHGFWSFFPNYRTSKLFLEDLAKGFAWLLEKEIDVQKIGNVLYLPSEGMK